MEMVSSANAGCCLAVSISALNDCNIASFLLSVLGMSLAADPPVGIVLTDAQLLTFSVLPLILPDSIFSLIRSSPAHRAFTSA